MRISTSMVYDQGVGGIQKQQADVLRSQQMVSTGRRILAPSDDPVAASTVLELTQFMNVNEQNGTNATVARNKLMMEESILTDVQNLIQDAKTIAVNAGGGSMTNADLSSLATELESRYQALLGLANTTDESGQFLFSGFMGGTMPFSEVTPGNVTYNGDQGQREIRINARRQVPVSDSGADVFQRIKNGNGTFVTAATAGNTGTGMISPGNVLDKTKWNTAANNKDFTIKFDVDNTTTPATTTYDIIDNVSGNSLLTGVAPAAAPYPRTFTSGAPISFSQVGPPAFDYGAELQIEGQPSTGDTFTVKASTHEDLFKTISNLINTINSQSGANRRTTLQNGLNTAMSNLDNALDNILTIRAEVGSRLKEVDAVQNTREDLTIQYQAAISNLQDVDYAKVISDLTLQQMHLQAAQKSFASTQSLTLFNYIS
jgi:flagellar hook-associated protein 3 FlgL